MGCITPREMSSPAPSDTIVAPATAPGEGAIAVIRLSGPHSLEFADLLFRPHHPPLPSSASPRSVLHGYVLASPDGKVIDDALLLVFRAPKSYTGEDSVEIQCHGGPQIVHDILDALFSVGARLAEPGEFTKRAFLNGKMDLTQAEAVGDLIHARSDRAARMAAAQLQDVLGERIGALYDELLALSADTEAMLDFPDDELPQEVPSDIRARSTALSMRLSALLATWNEGQILRDGLQLVIAGAPNTGKSTLLNLLAGRNRAIVSPYPGTTRDLIEVETTFHGYPVRIVDTAGLRQAPDPVEKEGIRRTRQALETADLTICLVDASQSLSSEEIDFLKSQNHKKTIVLANKTDLGDQSTSFCVPPHEFWPISLKNLTSSDGVIQKILQKTGLDENTTKNSSENRRFSSENDSGNVAVSSRHKMALHIALQEVKYAENKLESNREEAFLPAAMHFRAAAEQMASILGKNWDEDTLNLIFSRFCVGK